MQTTREEKQSRTNEKRLISVVLFLSVSVFPVLLLPSNASAENATTVPSQDKTTTYMKNYIANPGDPILSS